jgi:outer membrane protein assembly factor BamB
MHSGTINRRKPTFRFNLRSRAALVHFALVLVSRLFVCEASAQVQPATLLWRLDIGETIVTEPTVAPNGTVYIISDSGLRAITNNGTVAATKWILPGVAGSNPALGVDGTLYLAGYDSLFAISAEGFVKWSYPIRTNSPSLPGNHGSPGIGFDNTIYVEGDAKLFAFDSSGLLKWSTDFPEQGGYTSPSIGQDGTIYAGAYTAEQLYAFDSSGAHKWVVNAQSGIGDSPAIAEDGTIYVNRYILYAFTPEGTNLWNTREKQSFATSSPIVASDGSIFLQDNPELTLFRITSAGEIFRTAAEVYLWHQGTPTMPAVDAAGTVWHWASNMVWALNVEGQILPWSHNLDEYYLSPQQSPTIGPDGTFYGVRGSRLYAITTGTNAPCRSQWPMSRQNSRHTGKIERPSLHRPNKLPDGNVRFDVMSQIDAPFTIQRSTDLLNWSESTNLLCTSVPMKVVDPGGSNGVGKFYRVLFQTR